MALEKLLTYFSFFLSNLNTQQKKLLTIYPAYGLIELC